MTWNCDEILALENNYNTSHFQGCESQEKLANVVDEPVAKFIKDIQNI